MNFNIYFLLIIDKLGKKGSISVNSRYINTYFWNNTTYINEEHNLESQIYIALFLECEFLVIFNLF